MSTAPAPGSEPDKWNIYGCRHGCMLLHNKTRKEIVLWDPLTGDRRVAAVPPEFDNEERVIWNGAVVCAAAGDPSHVHCGFGSCPFEVALVGVTRNHTQVFVCIYSSEIGTWSDLVAAATPFTVYCVSDPGTLVGNALFWFPVGLGYGILEFNLDRHSLDVIEWPSSIALSGSRSTLLAQHGGLGLAILSYHSLQMWERKVCSEGVTEWVLQKTHNLCKIHGRKSGSAAVLGPKNSGKLISSTDITRTQVSMIQVSRVSWLQWCRDGSLVYPVALWLMI
ncbi:hypothetical protein PVAP13_6KG262600 [Panicum virgatum]|uniref:Uncharacterized protein n=1 Tax=Panicum virgatum TaxID=38727 RepID=A0A8T0REJ0_PANVG|nr:hypothetical protein PVAP13_6KG262600 [Panicum virgatum]